MLVRFVVIVDLVMMFVNVGMLMLRFWRMLMVVRMFMVMRMLMVRVVALMIMAMRMNVTMFVSLRMVVVMGMLVLWVLAMLQHFMLEVPFFKIWHRSANDNSQHVWLVWQLSGAGSVTDGLHKHSRDRT